MANLNNQSHESRLKRPFQDGGSDDGDHPPSRPQGSKRRQKQRAAELGMVPMNKPDEAVIKTYVLVIPPGHNIIQSLYDFACKVKSFATVLSGIGLISHAQVSLPVPNAPPLFLNGPYSLIGFNGTLLVGPAAKISEDGNFTNIIIPSVASFTISVADPNGNVFGGFVKTKLIAMNNVTVVVAVHENIGIHKISAEVPSGDPSSAHVMPETPFNVTTPIPWNNHFADPMSSMQFGTFSPY